MYGQRRLFILISAVICWGNALTARSQNLSEEWVEQVAAPLVENRIADGLSVGYIEGDHWGIVHLGESNRAKQKANNRTVYEIGSVSKVFTGLLLADAVVRGEIDLNATAEVEDSAGIQLPSLEGRSIRWNDLSTHRSGLPRMPSNFPQPESSNPYRDYDSKKAAAFVNAYKLPRQPGESQEYSNFAVSVLGYLVAEKAGQSYDELLKERITKPLGMSDCTVSLSKDQRKRLALPHDKFDSPTALWTFADLPGAGGIHATMRDIMRFAKSHLTPPPGTIGEAIDLAWKQHHEADASGPAMALGWLIADDGQTRWHNGQTGGSHSAIFINRELECAVIVLCNTAIPQVDQLAMQLIQKAAGLEDQTNPSETSDEKPSDLVIDAKLRARLVGQYQLAPDFIMDVQDRDGQLTVQATNQPVLEVLPDSPTRWTCQQVGATLEFKLPKTGPAYSLILHQGGAKQTAQRIEMEPAERGDAKIAIDKKLRHRLEGRYQLNPNFIFDVNDRDGHLMVGITNQPTQEVYPDSATRWSYRGVDATLEFKLPKTGPARSLILHQNNAAQTARRIK